MKSETLTADRIAEIKARTIDLSDIPELTEADFSRGSFRNIDETSRRTEMKAAKDKKNKRYCTVEESLIQSFKEVKLMRAGLMPQKPWAVFEKEVRELAEKVKSGESD